jgi:hypothetical protein
MMTAALLFVLAAADPDTGWSNSERDAPSPAPRPPTWHIALEPGYGLVTGQLQERSVSIVGEVSWSPVPWLRPVIQFGYEQLLDEGRDGFRGLIGADLVLARRWFELFCGLAFGGTPQSYVTSHDEPPQLTLATRGGIDFVGLRPFLLGLVFNVQYMDRWANLDTTPRYSIQRFELALRLGATF